MHRRSPTCFCVSFGPAFVTCIHIESFSEIVHSNKECWECHVACQIKHICAPPLLPPFKYSVFKEYRALKDCWFIRKLRPDNCPIFPGSKLINLMEPSSHFRNILQFLKYRYESFMYSKSVKSWWNVKKKKGVRWDFEGPVSSGYLAYCSHPFFMSIRIEFSASYFYAISVSHDTDFAGQVVYKP